MDAGVHNSRRRGVATVVAPEVYRQALREKNRKAASATRTVEGKEAPTGVEPVYQVLQTCA